MPQKAASPPSGGLPSRGLPSRGLPSRGLPSRLAVALSCAVVIFATTLTATPSVAQASGVASDQTQVSQLEAQIANEGTAIQQLVARSNQAQTQLIGLQRSLAAEQGELQADKAGAATAAARLRAVALYEYINGSKSLADALPKVQSLAAKADAAMIESEYVSAAGVNVSDAIHTYSHDQKLVAGAEAHTKALARATTQALFTLTADRQAAQQALTTEETTLSQVKGNLAVLLAAAQEQQAAAQRASEEALAMQARSPQPPTTTQGRSGTTATSSNGSSSPPAEPPVGLPPAQTPQSQTPQSQTPQSQTPQSQTIPPQDTTPRQTTAQPTPTPVTTEPAPVRSPAPTYQAVTAPTLQLVQAPAPVVPSPGSYSNPLRSVAGLYPERIDQGVDYSGLGPIYALGDGVVLSVTNAGWPGGTFIAYRLTDGPAAGLTVYAAEDILPSVTLGQEVTSSTVLGTMFEGPDGIETGWASYAGTGATMAYGAGQFDGSNSTAFGYNFSQLLNSVGAPSGVLQNNPPTGNLPPGWPQW